MSADCTSDGRPPSVASSDQSPGWVPTCNDADVCGWADASEARTTGFRCGALPSSRPTRRMLIVRFMLWVRCRAISVLTFLSVIIWGSASLPSKICRRDVRPPGGKNSSYPDSDQACTASRTASCSQREIRRRSASDLLAACFRPRPADISSCTQESVSCTVERGNLSRTNDLPPFVSHIDNPQPHDLSWQLVCIGV
jgi:hypothetical protein